jgi:Uncharacterised nucleotidyltransferase
MHTPMSALDEKWKHFRRLANLISPYALPPENVYSLEDWQHIIAVADLHWVTPALLRPAKELKAVPQDVLDYLSGVHTLNQQRNTTHLNAVEELLERLHKHGIEPVMLKGAAALTTDLYDDPDERIIGDLDFLVPKARLKETEQLVRSLGYQPFPDKAKTMPSIHLPRLHHEKTGVTIEVHFDVVARHFPKMIPTARALADRKLHDWRGTQIATLSDQDRVIHNIMHLQTDRPPRCNLRQLREFAMMQFRCRDTVTWPELESRFESMKYLDGYLDHVSASREFLHTPNLVSEKFAKRAASRLLANMATDFDILLPSTSIGRTLYFIRLHATALRMNPHFLKKFLRASLWQSKITDLLQLIGRGKK